MADPIENFRKNFYAGPSNNFINMNNAGVSPISAPAREAVALWSKRMYEEGLFCIDEAYAESNRLRETLASFLGGTAGGLSFFQTTAAAISQVALGLKFSAGDEIVVWDQEYPSNLYPWRVAAERSGARVIIAESAPDLSTPIERLIAKVTPRTRVIATSWVQYRTGAIMDLAALAAFARPKGIFTCADIIQGVGMMPFDFKASGMDAVCGGTHKWLAAPATVGYMLLREEHVPKLEPVSVGAMTYGDYNDLGSLTAKIRTGPDRFEPGSRNLLEHAALLASLKLFSETGIDRIAQEIEWLSRKLMHGLRERGYVINSPHGSHHRGSIVNFSPSAQSRYKTLPEIEERLKGAWIAYGVRPPGVRLSPHAHNTSEQIDKVLEILS